MAKTADTKPSAGKSKGRDSRLAAALRENLRRRKAQARGRATSAQSTARDEAPKAGKGD